MNFIKKHWSALVVAANTIFTIVTWAFSPNTPIQLWVFSLIISIIVIVSVVVINEVITSQKEPHGLSVDNLLIMDMDNGLPRIAFKDRYNLYNVNTMVSIWQRDGDRFLANGVVVNKTETGVCYIHLFISISSKISNENKLAQEKLLKLCEEKRKNIFGEFVIKPTIIRTTIIEGEIE